MAQDLRSTALYQEIEAYFQLVNSPAFGRIAGARDLAPSPDGRRIAFTGSKRDQLEGLPTTRICIADRESSEVEEVTQGPNDDGLPR